VILGYLLIASGCLLVGFAAGVKFTTGVLVRQLRGRQLPAGTQRAIAAERRANRALVPPPVTNYETDRA
jgi:hypothetical protein